MTLRPPAKLSAPRLALAVLVALIALQACAGQRRSLARDALMRDLAQLGAQPAEPVPTLDDLREWRVPALPTAAPPAPTAGALARARYDALVVGDSTLAERSIAQLASASEKEVLRCLLAHAQARPALAVRACAAALDALAAEPRGLGVLGALLQQRGDAVVVDEVILGRVERWLSVCAKTRARDGGCADLAYVLRRAEVRAASRAKDASRAHAAARASGALRAPRVDGPYDGDGIYTFAAAGSGADLVPGVRHFSGGQPTWNGEVRPAMRGEPGLYRMTWTGQGRGPTSVFVSSSAAVRVLVDGRVLLERTPALCEEPAVTRAALDLAPGWHRVEILAVAHGPASVVRVALLSADGQPALAERAAPRGARFASSTPLQVAPLLPAVDDDAPVEAVVEHALLRAHAEAMGVGVPADAQRSAARTMLREFGASPVVVAYAATQVATAFDVPRSQARSDASPLWTRVLQAWPDHPRAASALADAVRDDRPDEALARYRALRAARPRHPAGHRGVAELAARNGLVGEATAAARSLTALTPPPASVGAALIALERAGLAVASARLTKERARADDDLYSSGWARFLLDDGQSEAAIAELERLVAAEPGHPASELLWDLLSLRSPRRALALVEDVRARFPNDRSAWRRRVGLLHGLDEGDAARLAVNEAVARFGADESLWRLRDELGEPPPWLDRLAIGDAAIAHPEAKTAMAGHAAVLLLDHTEQRVFEDRSAIHVRHFIIRLDGKEALDAFGELSIPVGEVLERLRVVKPDGRELLPEHPPGVQDVSLTGLAAGDVVELVGVSFLDAPRFGVPSFDVRSLRRDAPVVDRSYDLHFPARWLGGDNLPRPPFALWTTPGAPAAEVTRTGARARARFTATELAKLVAEPHTPHLHESAPVIGWSFAADEDAWRVVRGTPLLRRARAEVFLDTVAERVAGEGSPRVRFARLFRFVTRRITPAEEPTAPSAVLAAGRGSRTALLFALARAARLDAHPVAIDGPASPPPGIPNPGRFGLLGVETMHAGGSSLALVDDGLAVLDALPASAAASRVLDLSSGGRVVVRRPPPTAVSSRPVRVQLKLELDEDGVQENGGALRGFLALTVPAYRADPLRRWLRAATEAERAAALERVLVASLPGVRVLEVRLPNIGAAGTPLGVGVSLEVPLERDGIEPLRFDHLFRDGASSTLGLMVPLSSYLGVATREQPLLFAPVREILQVEWSLPEGGAFTEVPPRLDEESGAVRLSQRAEVTDGTLFWTRTIDVELARVSVREWPEVARGLAALAGRTDARVAFVIPP